MSAKNKIKLVQIIADSDLGGGPTHVFGLLKHINKSLFDCYLICPPGDLARQARDIPNLEVIDLDMRSKFDLVAYYRLSQELTKIQSAHDPFGPIIVHTHGPRAGLLGRLANPRGAYSVYTEHRWDADFHLESVVNEWLQLFLLALMNRKSNLIIAVSSAVREFLISRKMAAPSRIKVIPNAFDINDAIKPKINNKKHNNHFIIGNVGNLNQQKGQIYLIEAMPEIVKHLPHTMLEIIGEGEERQRLESKIHELGLQRHVTLLGKQSNPMQRMQHWDIFVLPSIAETFGIVILEAFACGLPVVASNVGGVKDIIKDHKNGLLVEAANPRALSSRTIELLDHPAQAAKYAREARETLKKYDWKLVIKDIEAAYLNIL